MTVETFTLDTFSERVGESFGVEISGAPPLELSLEAVREIPPLGWRPEEAAAHRQPFALELLGPPQFILPQQIYRFTSGTLGTFEIFIVPIGRTAAGITYEAVFS